MKKRRRRAIPAALLLLLPCSLLSSRLSDWFLPALPCADFYLYSSFSDSGESLKESDKEIVDLYSAIFQKYNSSSNPEILKKIPRVIHFIWGGREFPDESVLNILSWMRLHPDWKFKFWTDRADRPVPVEGMEKHLFDELLRSPIDRLYSEAANWGEKSDVLRYEILLREGGVYVDHDVECIRPFGEFHDRLEFYAPLEPIHQSPLEDTVVTVTNCLIGARPAHPIMAAAIENTLKRWDAGAKTFPHADQLSTMLRTLSRTFVSFDLAVREHIAEGNGLVFPSTWVFPEHCSPATKKRVKKTGHVLADHKWNSSWFKDVPKMDSYEHVERLISKISLFDVYIDRFMYSLISISFVFSFILLLSRKKRDGAALQRQEYS